MQNDPKNIRLSIVAILMVLVSATLLAVYIKVLYGLAILLGFALIVVFVRLFAQDDVWFKAKNRVVDVLFIAFIILIFVLTLPYINQPSPV